MPQDLELPSVGKKDTVKNQIVRLLSSEHPLSLASIHRALYKKFHSDVSFQAVRKAANSLIEGRILGKNEKKEYAISREWILGSKKFFDSLAAFYQTRAKSRIFDGTINQGNYNEYHLSSLFELDNFWTDILVHWADNIEPSEPRDAAVFNNLHWWFLINYGNEMALWKYVSSKGVKGLFICPEKIFVNELAVKNYRTIPGFKARTINARPFPENVDVNVVGHHVLQVNFPTSIIKKLGKFFRKYKSMDKFDVKGLNGILDTKCDIKLVFMRNPEMASAYRERIIDCFRAK